MALEGLQRKLSQELEKYKQYQKDYQKTVSLRQQLDGQLTENNVVKEEMDLLDAEAAIYKLIGPVLVKEEVDSAKMNVNKRIEFISGELKHHDNALQETEKKLESTRETLNKLQQQLQQAQVQVAMNA